MAVMRFLWPQESLNNRDPLPLEQQELIRCPWCSDGKAGAPGETVASKHEWEDYCWGAGVVLGTAGDRV